MKGLTKEIVYYGLVNILTDFDCVDYSFIVFVFVYSI